MLCPSVGILNPFGQSIVFSYGYGVCTVIDPNRKYTGSEGHFLSFICVFMSVKALIVYKRDMPMITIQIFCIECHHFVPFFFLQLIFIINVFKSLEDFFRGLRAEIFGFSVTCQAAFFCLIKIQRENAGEGVTEKCCYVVNRKRHVGKLTFIDTKRPFSKRLKKCLPKESFSPFQQFIKHLLLLLLLLLWLCAVSAIVSVNLSMSL